MTDKGMTTKPHGIFMSAPTRIQLSRKKGFNLQAVSLALNGLPAVNCSRRGKWGNPVKVGPGETNHFAVACFRDILREGQTPPFALANIRDELRGKNLACWCKLNDECHCSVLLEIANERTEKPGDL